MPDIPNQFISNENPYSFSSTIGTDPYNAKKERLESINRLQPPFIPIGIDTKSLVTERSNIVSQVKQTLIRNILVTEYNRISCYLQPLDNKVGDMKERGEYDCGIEGSVEGNQEGVNNSTANQQDVNNSTYNQQGVNNSTYNQQGVNNSTANQQGVNNSTANQQGVSSNTDNQHTFSTNTPNNPTISNNNTTLLLSTLTSYLHSINYTDTQLLSSLIKVRKLMLHTKQQTLRTSVYKSISSSLSPSQLLSSTQKHTRNTLTDLYILNTLESKYKTEQLKRETYKKIEICRNIIDAYKRILSNLKTRYNTTERFYKSISHLTHQINKQESKRQERLVRERLKALRNQDEQAYLQLLKEKKDDRIEYILKKTDEYLYILTEKLRARGSMVGGDISGGSMLGGVSNSTDTLHPVSNSTDNYHPVNDTTNNHHPVSNSTDNYHPVNDTNNNHHPVSNSTDTNPNTDYFLTAHLISEPILVQPSYIKGTLKEYQLRGIEWLLSLYNNNLNGILADEMGLGKTIQTIGFISYLTHTKNIKGSYLIICPLSVMSNWKREFNKWCPSLSVIEYKGIPEVRKGIQRELRVMCGSVSGGSTSYSSSTYPNPYTTHSTTVILTTYEYVVKDRNFLSRIPWFYLIVDEGHRLKNKESKLSSVISNKYNSKYRLLITGTPLQNNLIELWGLLNFVLPYIFNSNKNFEEWFNMGVGGGVSMGSRLEGDKGSIIKGGGCKGSNLKGVSYKDGKDSHTYSTALCLEEQMLLIQRLHKVLRPFLLRRLKRDVEVLPDKVERVIRVNMSGVQRYLYNRVLGKDLDRGVSNRDSNNTPLFTGTGNNTLYPLNTNCLITNLHNLSIKDLKGTNNSLMQLRKICNHPFCFEEVEQSINPSKSNNALLYSTCGKFEILNRILPKLKINNHKILMFFQMTQVMTIMEDFLLMKGYKYLRLDGNVKVEDRNNLIRTFNEEDYFIFMLSTRAGGLGLNLQVADTVIIYDSDWNPFIDLQAQDRAHRVGQKKEVRIYRLITHSSVEEVIYDRAYNKIRLDNKVIQAGMFDQRSTQEERDILLNKELCKVYDMGSKDSRDRDTKDRDTDINNIGNANIGSTKDTNLGIAKDTLSLYEDLNYCLSNEDINDMLARNEEEMRVFREMDREYKGVGLVECGCGWCYSSKDVDRIGGNQYYNNQLTTTQYYKGIGDLLSDITSLEEDGRKRMEIFMELPDKRLYPDYYVIISKPISYNCISKRIGKYRSVEEVKEDFYLMFDNAMRYNIEGSVVYRDAYVLKEYVKGYGE